MVSVFKRYPRREDPEEGVIEHRPIEAGTAIDSANHPVGLGSFSQAIHEGGLAAALFALNEQNSGIGCQMQDQVEPFFTNGFGMIGEVVNAFREGVVLMIR